MENGKYQVRAIVQHPCLVCNEQAAILWCPDNPFLCGIGARSHGNCLDGIEAPLAVPIKHVFKGKSWFVAVKADHTIMSWGELPDCLQRVAYPREVHSATEIVALVWDNWSGKYGMGVEEQDPEPLKNRAIGRLSSKLRSMQVQLPQSWILEGWLPTEEKQRVARFQILSTETGTRERRSISFWQDSPF